MPPSLEVSPVFKDLEGPGAGGLLERARAGDAEAFCALCRPHEAGLLRQAAALCRDAALAEELAQDTLIEAWKGLRRYNGRCRFFTWLCAILLNRYRNTLRARRSFLSFARLSAEERAEPLGHVADGQPRPDQALQRVEQAELLRKCVQALPHKHQQVIHLRFFVDDSLAGIAAALGCSVGTVKSRLFHALDRLRAMKEIDTLLGRLDVKPPDL